jgi:Flp pilus assembly protein TadG
VIPIALFIMLGLFGVMGFVVDAGRLYIAFEQLTASTDAAALAGGSGLPSMSAAQANAMKFDGVSGNNNYFSNLPGVTLVTSPPTVKCIEYTDLAIPCSTALGTYNAIQVSQTVSVPMTFSKFFGAKAVTLTATATASSRGAPSTPYNIAMIIDNTASMSSGGTDSCTDPYTGDSYTTSEGCALVGARVLLHNTAPCAGDLSPCPAYVASTNYATSTADANTVTNAVDMVSLLIFPNGEANTMCTPSGCTTIGTGCGNPTINKTYGYTFPDIGNSTQFPNTTLFTNPGKATNPVYYGRNYNISGTAVNYPPYVPSTSTQNDYQVTTFDAAYRQSDANSTLNADSALVNAIGGNTSCAGLTAPGGLQTFYAGALVAAQELVTYQQSQRTGSQNAIILLSDGAANSTSFGTESNSTMGNSNTSCTNTGCTTACSTSNYSTLCPGWISSVSTTSSAYPSQANQCQQAVNVASSITKSGTTIYAVGYGSEETSSSCSTDTKSITPCRAMSEIASTPETFFTDDPGGKSSGCTSTENPETALSQIFQAIAGDLTKARLIPNNVFSDPTS